MEVFLEEGRVFIKFEGGEEAFLTFGVDKEKRVIVVSTTYVPESQRGKGIARLLNKKLAEFARENGYKIYPLCSYTEKFLKRESPELLAR
ncbi:GNAT family N-acetyltransferase [Thermovibrio sp.]